MQNKKSAGFVALTVAVGLVASTVSSYARAEEDHGPWGVGLRGGFAIQSQTLNTTAGTIRSTGSLGPVIESEVQYDLSNHFSVGLGTEWEHHTVKTTAVAKIGSINTVSILPFTRYQFNLNSFHPYFSLGLGYSINSFGISGTIAGVPTAGITTSLGNSFSVKPGVGFNYFVTKSLALNAEFDWKWNKANLTATIPVAGLAGTFPVNMSSVQFLAGAKYFF